MDINLPFKVLGSHSNRFLLCGFKINFPVFVSVYLVKEFYSVTVDSKELKHKYDHKALVLNKREFRNTIYDGKNTNEYFKTVD
jgi:hypothetical protein